MSHMNCQGKKWFGLLVGLLLLSGCAGNPCARSQLVQFWHARPANGNRLELAGYDRSFAARASPSLIDEMIADQRRNSSDANFETYALIIYYMPRPASTNHLVSLREAASAAEMMTAARFEKKLADIQAEYPRNQPEGRK